MFEVDGSPLVILLVCDEFLTDSLRAMIDIVYLFTKNFLSSYQQQYILLIL